MAEKQNQEPQERKELSPETIKAIEELSARANAYSELANLLKATISDPSFDLAGSLLDKYKGPFDVFDVFDENGEPLYGELISLLHRLKAETGAPSESIERAEKELLKIKYAKTTEIKTVTDKLPNFFFSLTAPQPKNQVEGQREMSLDDMIPLKYEKKNAKKEITLFYDYAYDEAKLKKHGLNKTFDDYDFFVMSICDNLKDAGNDIVTLRKIFAEMGGRDNPTAKQLEPIYHSLLKGLSTTITINDLEVRQAWGNDPDGKYHEIISPVMPVIIGAQKFIANGKVADGYVKITDVSPFWKVAKPIGHVTAWEKTVLKLYTGRRTRRYYSVLRFLMVQIGWLRNEKSRRSNKVVFSTLYKYTGDTTTRAQQLTRDMMYRLLDEVFIPAEYVTGYEEEATPTPGVILHLHKKRLQLKGNN